MTQNDFAGECSRQSSVFRRLFAKAMREARSKSPLKLLPLSKHAERHPVGIYSSSKLYMHLMFSNNAFPHVIYSLQVRVEQPN